ncbi:MAG: LamG-like jellyroll fold domain-containing protein [Planctomycetota bacterium]|jgi:hypothetical protein
MIDVTPQGNDGTLMVSTVESTILGPFRRYLPNSGANATVLGGANAFPLNDVTVAFWCRKDLGSTSTDWIINYFQGFGTDAWGIRFIGGTNIGIYDDIDNADVSLYSTAVPRSKLVHITAQMDSLENLLYIDGTLVGSGTASSDDWASFAGTLYHGSRFAVSGPVAGIVGPLQVFNEAMDQSWVTEEYLKGARAVQFRTDWGVRQSIGNETAGFLGVGSSPFDILSGTWQMSTDTIEGRDVKVVECIAPGVVAIPTSYFEATPTEAAFGTHDFWVSKADASITYVIFIAGDDVAWNAATQNGYALQLNNTERVILGRITAGVFTNLTVTAVDTVVPDTWYRFRIPRRYDGQFTTYMDGVAVTATGGTNPVTDLTHTTASHVVLDFDAGDKFAYSDRHGEHCFVKYLGVVAP